MDDLLDLPLFQALDRAQAPPAPGPMPSPDRAALQALRASAGPAQAKRATAALCSLWEGRIRALAKAWTCSGLDLDDLCQAGALGLLRAAQTADPTRSDPEITAFLYSHVRKELERLSRRQGRIVVESEHERRQAGRVGRALAKDPDLTDQALSERLGLTQTQVQRARTGRRGVDQELDPGSDPAGPDPELDPAERAAVRAAVADVLRAPGLVQLLPSREVLTSLMDGAEDAGTNEDRTVIRGLVRSALHSRGVVALAAFLVLFLIACSAR